MKHPISSLLMGIKIICENKKAGFNYQILEKYEAGIVLQGSEVKSLRDRKANLGDSYGVVRGGEIFLLNAHISPYQAATYTNHDPLRTRKLLFRKSEIKRLIGKISERGFTLIPLKFYFKEGKVKLEIALGKSKKMFDKRETIKKREADRQLRRVLKRSSR